MTGKTSIEWTDWSASPIRARLKSTGAVGHYCEKIAPGCANCYASTMQRRFQMPSFGSGQKRDDVEIFLDESVLERIRKRKKPTRFFIEDMSDLFGDWMKPEWLKACFETFDACPQHTFQLLTKRPENVRKMIPTYFPSYIPEAGSMNRPGPRPNVWLGVSVSEQASANKLVPELLHCRDLAAVLFLSAEPLLGLTILSQWLDEIDLVIVGGESGPGARPMHPMWARSIRDQCQATGVAFFYKQHGAYSTEQHGRQRATMVHSGVAMDEPIGMFNVGKKVAGRLLDGREWNEMPDTEEKC